MVKLLLGMKVKSIFFMTLLPSISSEESGTFSQRYSGPSLDLMSPTQVQGYEVILRIFKAKYIEQEINPNINIACKVIDQRLSYDRRHLESRKINLRDAKEISKRDLAHDIFAQYHYLDVDFTLTFSSDDDDYLMSGNINRFMEFMNSEEGIQTTIEYISELGLPIEEVYPLRIVQPSTTILASAYPPPLPLLPTRKPDIVVERFSVTLEGSELKSMTRDELIAFEIFLELFTGNFGKSGGEPNVDTSCQIINQDLSIASLRRNLSGKMSLYFSLRQRDLTNIDPSIKIYFLDVKFAMIWRTSNPDVNLVSDRYLDDFISYMKSDSGMNDLKNKLHSVGVLVENVNTIRVIDASQKILT